MSALPLSYLANASLVVVHRTSKSFKSTNCASKWCSVPPNSVRNSNVVTLNFLSMDKKKKRLMSAFVGVRISSFVVSMFSRKQFQILFLCKVIK